MSAGRRIVMVAAFARNRVIGNKGEIPWHIPEDFAHFKRTTLGHTLVMGRATWDSIGRPLPGRTTVVVTRDRSWSTPWTPTTEEGADDRPGPQVHVAHSVQADRSEEHTSELQSLMRISYAVFCLQKKKNKQTRQ